MRLLTPGNDLVRGASGDHRRMIVRREDLLSLFTTSELFLEIGKRWEKVEDESSVDAARAIVSKIVELRNVSDEDNISDYSSCRRPRSE